MIFRVWGSGQQVSAYGMLVKTQTAGHNHNITWQEANMRARVQQTCTHALTRARARAHTHTHTQRHPGNPALQVLVYGDYLAKGQHLE